MEESRKWSIHKVGEYNNGGHGALCWTCRKRWEFVEAEVWDHIVETGHQVRIREEHLTIWERES